MNLKTVFFSAILGLLGCNNQPTTSNPATKESQNKQIAQQLNNVVAKYEDAPQLFNVSSQKTSSIKGKQGTIIFINPNDLTTDNGEPINGNIEVELKELTNQKQLLNSNATTTSNGRLLVSGGAYYINMSAAGKPLKLKTGKTLSVEFPQITTEKMGLFYGYRDSLGQLNWVETNQEFQSQASEEKAQANSQKLDPKNGETDLDDIIALEYVEGDSNSPRQMSKKEWEKQIQNSIKEAEKVQNETRSMRAVYKSIQLNTLGWINCDKFLENANNTDLFVNFSPVDSIQNANLCLIFHDINSVVSGFYNVSVSNKVFSNIPIGYKVQLVAYAIKDEKIWLHNSQFVIQANQSITLTMKETNEKELAQIFASR